jgi:hypothetical protein
MIWAALAWLARAAFTVAFVIVVLVMARAANRERDPY